MSFSGRSGTGRIGGRSQQQKFGAHRILPDNCDGVHYIHPVDCPGGCDHRHAVRHQAADQSQAQQRAVAPRSQTVDPRHNAEQRRRGKRHEREQRPAGAGVHQRRGKIGMHCRRGPERQDLSTASARITFEKKIEFVSSLLYVPVQYIQ